MINDLLSKMSVKIPLHDKHKDVIGYALISPEDEDRVRQHAWHRAQGYAVSSIKRKLTRMQHLIIGFPAEGMVADHINNDRLDNRRENLRFVTFSQNSQNVPTKNKSYRGVSYNQRDHNWGVQCGGRYVGKFENPEEAGKAYDRCAYVIYGTNARTNGLVTYDECKDLTLDDVIKKTLPKKLPKNVVCDRGRYYARFTKDNKTVAKSPYYDTAIEAETWATAKRLELEADAEHELMSREITRNEAGQAIIKCTTVNAIVDDDLWYELVRHHWSVKFGYPYVTINRHCVYMHRYVMQLRGHDLSQVTGRKQIIDHINQTRHDNRYVNLRITSVSGNTQNKKKLEKEGLTSSYLGVRYSEKIDKWNARISMEGKSYDLGKFETEIEAGIAYNRKARELYGEHAQLNDIDETAEIITVPNAPRVEKMRGYQLFMHSYKECKVVGDSLFKEVSQAWHNLTQEERDKWNQKAYEIPSGTIKSKKGGNKMRGYQLFMNSFKGTKTNGEPFMTFISRKWKQLTPDEQKVWNDKAKQTWESESLLTST